MVFKIGYCGDEVKQIQKKLKDWGYYEGNVDGIYGSKTYNAVKKFQSKNGLKVDGIVYSIDDEIVLDKNEDEDDDELGKKYSIDESCLSSKIYLGHVASLKNKCDYILIPRIDNYGKNEKVEKVVKEDNKEEETKTTFDIYKEKALKYINNHKWRKIMELKKLIYTVEDGIAVITMNYLKNLNAIDEQMADELSAIVVAEIEKIAAEGPLKEDMDKTREFLLKDYKKNVELNGWWSRTLTAYYDFGVDNVNDYEAAVNGVTADDVKALAKRMLDEKSMVKVIMRPEK